ncbi:hydroxyacid dehydrogenase [Virgibacillus profundi]|uniref:Hydroxyacid dehydrogenase n=1 Tax=Virgibacillus profundi TaxID=2024555 RepID=A0A2A2IGF4_9BACI|nr:hydroxyacid dehydrogenase [Virgibacillus profundi]PAV30737.1 hydroxyacid dehydrogenase [Virgibacillus profundi]PXY54921.1 hydroxyacid dehydrogenase [Virgibacillus profundi]
MKILVTELMWEDGMEELKRKGYTVDYDMELSRKRKELLELVPGYDALIVRNETRVDTELLDAAKNTRVIGRLGVGLDNIDLNACKARGIPVIPARNANATSVAEYVMAAMLDASRPLSAADADVRRGNWDRKFFTGSELNNRTLGLIGMGEIANRVARRANVFGMNVIGYDPFVAPFDHVIQETHVRPVETLDELLSESDFVSIHVPLTNATRYLLNHENFPLMKPHAHVINSARGGIIHEEDLIEAVQLKQIAGAYLDVLEKEPVQKDSLLTKVESIRLSPHIAGLTVEAQSRTAMLIAREVDKVLGGGESICAVV